MKLLTWLTILSLVPLSSLAQFPQKILLPVYQDTSPSLTEMVALSRADSVKSPKEESSEEPRGIVPSPFVGSDPVAQTHFGDGPQMNPIVSFPGVDFDEVPSDANGAAGLDHYVQTVNRKYAIWNKQGGLVLPPQYLHTLWTGTQWENSSYGDPIVLFDRNAERWLFVHLFNQITESEVVWYLLFAISASADPLGQYHRYSYSFPDLPDYPKIGVWHDAYYISFAGYLNDQYGEYFGDAAGALERDVMLAGGPDPRMILFQVDPAHSHILPSDADGSLPIAGTPNYFAGLFLAGQMIRIYEFTTNWANPNLSTFVHTTSLSTEFFVAPVCYPEENCVNQPASSVILDAISDKLMYRLQYRDFGHEQAMVANHTVRVTDGTNWRSGIRWYQLKKSTGNWSIYQQSTYSPDANHRWAGSIAMDKYGNIAMGYSVSSAQVYPSIRYTGRRLSDPLGVMTLAEGTIAAGGGSSYSDRWGDYSSIRLDPQDDWTFWYTSQFIHSGSDWSTYIGSFQVPIPTQEVLLTQMRQDFTTMSGTNVGRWNGSTFQDITITNPPSKIDPEPLLLSTETLRGKQQLEGSEKYRLWMRNGEELLDYVWNHRSFTIDHSLVSLASLFHGSSPSIVIKNQLIDSPGNENGSIKFKDPWYIDYSDPDFLGNNRNRGHDNAIFYGRTSPFHPDYSSPFPQGPYKGVLLNQSGSAVNWIPPYYKVGTTTPQTIGGVASNFFGWSGIGVEFEQPSNLETGVTFQENNSVAIATYKAAMRTNSTTALSPNSHRKIVRLHNSNYYACYVSAGHIWLTMSTNQGGTWSVEKRVSLDEPAGFTNGSASISLCPASSTDPAFLLVAWEASGPDPGGWRSKVYCKTFDLDNLGFVNRVDVLQQIVHTGQFSARPAVAARITTGHSHALLAWYDPTNGPKVWGRVFFAAGPGTATALTSSGGSNFCLAPNGFYEYTDANGWSIAWSSGDALYYRTFGLVNNTTITLGNQQTVTCCQGGVGSISLVHTHPYGSGYQQAAIAWMDNGLISSPTVVGGYSLRFKQQSGGNWSGATSVWTDVSSSTVPSLTFNYFRQAFSLAWENGGNIRHTKKETGSWSTTTTIASGYTPSVSISVPGHIVSSKEIVLSRGSSYLYPIAGTDIWYQYVPPEENPHLPPELVNSQGRAASLTTPNSSVYFRILTPQINSSRVAYRQLNDTLATERNQDFEGQTLSRLFTGSGQFQCDVYYKATGAISPNFRVRMGLIDDSTNQLLSTLATFGGVQDTTATLSIPLDFPGRRVRVKVLASSVPQNARYQLEQWFLPTDESQNIKTKVHGNNLEQDASAEIPIIYALHPNHPNPFNPSTVLDYDLPEPGNVSLAIFDVLGREVAVLANGFHQAGFHNVTWNAGSAASGVYLARFVVRSEFGAVTYSKVNKLVLMK